MKLGDINSFVYQNDLPSAKQLFGFVPSVKLDKETVSEYKTLQLLIGSLLPSYKKITENRENSTTIQNFETPSSKGSEDQTAYNGS